MDRNLALEFVRITEAAAMACARYMGKGDEKAADQAAVDSMRKAFDKINIDGTVVIGEGERDEAPMLFIGEKVGMVTATSPKIDIALDPLEGTTICANGGVGALAVIAVAEEGNFLHAPDTYMDKIACGPKCRGLLSLENSPTKNIQIASKALDKKIEDVVVVILDRPRHKELIDEVRSCGARIQLIDDGDVSAGIATCFERNGIDLLLGTGGAPEGVITAAALKCMGGDFFGRLNFRNEDEKKRATKMGVTDFNKIYTRDELAKGDVMFCATGVTGGPLLEGVTPLPGNKCTTHSLVLRSKTGTQRFMRTSHNLNLKSDGFSK